MCECIVEVKFPFTMNSNNFADTFSSQPHMEMLWFLFLVLFEKKENVSTSAGDAMF